MRPGAGYLGWCWLFGLSCCAAGDHLAAQLGVGRENAAVDDEVLVRTRHERGQAFDERERRKQQVRGAIMVGALELERDATVCGHEQSLGGHRGPRAGGSRT